MRRAGYGGRIRLNGGGGVRRTQVAPRAAPSAGIVKGTPMQSGPKLTPGTGITIPTSTGPVRITPRASIPLRLPPNILDRGFIGPDNAGRAPQYSKEQIQQMYARGEIQQLNDRGEKETGIETELEQQSRAADATKQFAIDSNGAVLPPTAEKPFPWGLLIAGAAAYFLF